MFSTVKYPFLSLHLVLREKLENTVHAFQFHIKQTHKFLLRSIGSLNWIDGYVLPYYRLGQDIPAHAAPQKRRLPPRKLRR